jgi:hypothetical protein
MIAEEASEDLVVDYGPGASSAPKDITKQLGIPTSLLQPYQEPASCARLKDPRRDDSSRHGYIKPNGARIC